VISEVQIIAFMARITIDFQLPAKLTNFKKEVVEYLRFLRFYFKLRGYGWFAKFEQSKDVLVDMLYMKRGRYARPFLHLGMVGLVLMAVVFGPLIFNQTESLEQLQAAVPVLATTSAVAPDFYTFQAEAVRQYRGGEIVVHVVGEGETISSIAERYGLNEETVRWENNLTEKAVIKPGQELSILPLDGVRHRVKRGETIYTIAKKYGLDNSQAQMIIDYPFNEFLSDETFELVAGQWLMVPEGVKPDEAAVPVARTVPASQLTPDAGSVVAHGSFVWPAAGRITQGYRFYHRAIDIASAGGGPILAADAGVVTTAGWPDAGGYGNRVVIDHTNGFKTLYAHLSVVQVQVGQRVNRGDVLGQMGTTGRSTGVHLHFEIHNGGVMMSPLDYLK